jgi:hypothetical protein
MTQTTRTTRTATTRRLTVLEAEDEIKRFIIMGYYGSEKHDPTYKNRKLTLAVNYAYECGGTVASSMLLGLQGSGPKGEIAVTLKDNSLSGTGISVGTPVFLRGSAKNVSEEDYERVAKALDVFVNDSGMPTYGVDPTTIKTLTEMRRNPERWLSLRRAPDM